MKGDAARRPSPALEPVAPSASQFAWSTSSTSISCEATRGPSGSAAGSAAAPPGSQSSSLRHRGHASSTSRRTCRAGSSRARTPRSPRSPSHRAESCEHRARDSRSPARPVGGPADDGPCGPPARREGRPRGRIARGGRRQASAHADRPSAAPSALHREQRRVARVDAGSPGSPSTTSPRRGQALGRDAGVGPAPAGNVPRARRHLRAPAGEAGPVPAPAPRLPRPPSPDVAAPAARSGPPHRPVGDDFRRREELTASEWIGTFDALSPPSSARPRRSSSEEGSACSTRTPPSRSSSRGASRPPCAHIDRSRGRR